MRATSFLHLLRLNLFRRPGRTLLLAVVLAIAAGFATAVVAAMTGLPSAIFEKVERSFPARRLIVRPPAMQLAMLQMEARITPEQAEAMAAIDGVAAAHPAMPLRVPISLRGDILGNTIQTDSFVWGVPRELIESDISPHADRPFLPVRWDRGSQIPAILPAFFVDMYNSGFAQASGLPQVDRGAAIGQRFDLMLGVTTMVPSTAKRIVVPGEVVGVTRDAAMLAVLMPLETVADMNKWYLGALDQPGYHMVFVELRGIDDYDAVVASLEALGMRVEGNRDLLSTVGFVLWSGAAILGALGAMVVGLAMLLFLATLTLTLQERAGQIGLIAAVGGARRTIIALYAAELALVVTIPAFVAATATSWGLRVAESRLLGSLPSLSFVPESLLWLPVWLPLAVTIGMLAVVAVCCGPQLIAAARRGPLAALQNAAP